MSKKIIGTTKLSELPVGHFASVNGSIVYRFASETKFNDIYWFPPGIMVVEKHGHLVMGDAYRAYGTGKDPDERGYYCDEIVQPVKKHCDNAIAMIRKMMDEKKLDGLSYVEHIYRLRCYIREWIEREKQAKV